MKAREYFIVFSLLVFALLGTIIYYNTNLIWLTVIFLPIVLLGIYDLIQTKHAINRNFPVIGHARYILEELRPEIMQYFVETDTEGRPISRMFRSIVYQRAKKSNDTTPFGTKMDVYRNGYEWMNHSIYAKHVEELNNDPRVLIGGPDCKKPYSASILNVSAMSFGSLSKNAVMALNKGAKIGGFLQNTGEGGIAEYHLKHGGDLTWQIGTGYFGCRTKEGGFSTELFKEKANLEQVKMIEIKLSQGAKPGHGGILPGKKNTEEIAGIRNVEPGIDVISPPTHSAFNNPVEMMHFIKQLRELTGGKPIGFKLCIGKKSEFIEICQAMIETGIKPDFITIDGGEGGTGAAPLEFSNSLGMPMRDGLAFAYDTLKGYNLKQDIKLIASGKIISGFHMARAFALGADLINSARAMMLAIGCIQALECNNNSCPVGVATQNKSLIKGLVVDDKALRVANFHKTTVHSFMELIAAGGLTKPGDLNRGLINRRQGMDKVVTYEDIFPYTKQGELLN